jgi:hypothetical protein
MHKATPSVRRIRCIVGAIYARLCNFIVLPHLYGGLTHIKPFNAADAGRASFPLPRRSSCNGKVCLSQIKEAGVRGDTLKTTVAKRLTDTVFMEARMTFPERLALVAAMALALQAGAAFASQTTTEAGDHKAHHPATASAPSAKTGKLAGVDEQMKQMQAMHEKMMTATTPEERAADGRTDEVHAERHADDGHDEARFERDADVGSAARHDGNAPRHDADDDDAGNDGPPVSAESASGQVASACNRR